MKKRSEHSLWIEKYRPKDLDKYIGSGVVKNRVKRCIEENDLPHFLFYGPSGTGKTTMAKLIAGNLNSDYMYINASDENGVETVREKIKQFAEAASFKSLKIIHLDEADRLTPAAQDALRFVIEEYALTTRFILTANHFERIIPALKSRCEAHKLVPPSKGEIARHLSHILDAESVEYELTDVASVIKTSYPDIRDMIKILQSNVENKKLVLTQIDTQDLEKALIAKLKAPTSKTWYEVRQEIANAQIDDYTSVYQFLFDNVTEFSNGADAEIVIKLDEYLWRSFVMPDKEINMMAMMASVLQIIQKAKLLR